MTSGESLVEGGVLSAVELVNGQLPDGLAPGRAVVAVAVALVGHPAKKGIQNVNGTRCAMESINIYPFYDSHIENHYVSIHYLFLFGIVIHILGMLKIT